MKIILIARDIEVEFEEITEIIRDINRTGYNEIIIPLETRVINLVKKLIEMRDNTWIVTKEVEDSTIGDYLYSCSQIINKEDKIAIVFYDILKNYINTLELDIKKILEKIMDSVPDTILITRNTKTNTENIYSIDVENKRLIKMDRSGRHKYSFIGISIFSGGFFNWIRERYGIEPDIVNRDLDEIVNEYLYNGHNINIYLIH